MSWPSDYRPCPQCSGRKARRAKTCIGCRDADYVGRFWARVDQSGGPDACWLWLGKRIVSGRYGVVFINYHEIRAHRYAFELTHGPIPTGLLVLHSCDNPPCVNPAHLRLGTSLDNARDTAARGRTANQYKRGPAWA